MLKPPTVSLAGVKFSQRDHSDTGIHAVGTYGTVKAVTTDQVSESGAEILLETLSI